MSSEMRLFTPEEATRTLPLVRKIVEDILRVGREVRDLHETHGEAVRGLDEFTTKVEALNELMAELTGLGCSFKDWNFEIGLVDFPSVIDDEEVLLCWRSDEPELRYYHGVNAGFAGRKPIPEHLLGISPTSGTTTLS